jgi:hypothetical protein
MKQGSREAGRARGQVGLELSPDHGMEDGNDLPGLHDERYLILDGADCDRIRFRERVPADGQQSGDGPGGRNLSQALRFSLFRPSAASSPFGDDAQRPAEPLPVEAPQQLRAVAKTCGPLTVEPLKMRFERTLSGAEDIRASTSHQVANEATAVPGAAHESLSVRPEPRGRPAERGDGDRKVWNR